MSAAKEKLSSLLQRLRASGKKSAVPQLLVEESKKRKSTRVVARVLSRYIPDFPHTEGGPAVSVTHTFGVVRLVVEDIILNDSAKAKDYFVTVSIGRQCLTSKSVRCPKPGIDGTARLCFKAGAEFVLQQGGATVVRVALFRQGTLDAGWSNRLIAWCEADLAAHFPIAAVPGNGTQCASAPSLATPLRSACTAPGTARPGLTTTATKTADRSGSLQPTDTPTTIIHGEDLPVFEGVFDLQDKDNANVTRGTARLSGRIASLAELERQVWSQLLLLADFDGSGHLSQAEFGILLRAFGAELTEEEVAEIFEFADTDKTGHCSVDELAALLAFFDHADDAATGSNGIGSSASHSRNNSDAGDPVNGSTDADADAGRSSDAAAREGLHPSTSFPALRTTISTESDNAFLFNKLVRRCPVDGAELSPDPSQRASNLIYVWLALSATREQHEADLRAGYKTESHAGASWMLRLSEWASHPLSRRDRRWNRTYRAGGLRVGAAANHILVFDRANRRIIEECISPVLTLAMRNLYQSKVGKTLMRQGLAKRLVALSAKEGKYRDSPESCRDIPSFVESFRGQIYIDEAERQLNEYVSFNDFFTRKLKPGSRPVAAADNPDVVVSAADCRMQVYDNIDEATRFWIKGRNFSIAGLLADDSPDRLIARRYKRGTMAIFRLAPQDYHRFHSPVDGSIVSINDISGDLLTVNPIAVNSLFCDVFTVNKRSVCLIDSPSFGLVSFIAIGATLVGSITWSITPGTIISKGQELGYFSFGGSTCIALFTDRHPISFDADLVANGKRSLETLVKMGERIGVRQGSGLEARPSEINAVVEATEAVARSVVPLEQRPVLRRLLGGEAVDGITSAVDVDDLLSLETLCVEEEEEELSYLSEAASSETHSFGGSIER